MKLKIWSRVVVFKAECEVPLDSGVPVASLEHQRVVVESEEQFNGE